MSYSIDVPVVSLKEKGFVLSDFALYATIVTNLEEKEAFKSVIAK